MAVVVVLVITVIGIFGVVRGSWGTLSFWLGVAGGATGAVLIADLLRLAYDFDGGRSYRLGNAAERDVFDTLRRKRGWQVYWPIPFDGMDVDLVAVSQRGVLAIEVKATALPWRINHEGIEGPSLSPVAQAVRGARKVRSLIRSNNGLVCIPIPVLIIEGAAEWPDGRHVLHDGVHVLSPRQLPKWLKSLENGRLTRAETELATDTIEAYLAQLDVSY